MSVTLSFPDSFEFFYDGFKIVVLFFQQFDSPVDFPIPAIQFSANQEDTEKNNEDDYQAHYLHKQLLLFLFYIGLESTVKIRLADRARPLSVGRYRQ